MISFLSINRRRGIVGSHNVRLRSRAIMTELLSIHHDECRSRRRRHVAEYGRSM